MAKQDTLPSLLDGLSRCAKKASLKLAFHVTMPKIALSATAAGIAVSTARIDLIGADGYIGLSPFPFRLNLESLGDPVQRIGYDELESIPFLYLVPISWFIQNQAV